MTRLVVDASVALKWVVPEDGSAEALALRGAEQLLAPDLICAEWSNALWKKTRRGEISSDEAIMAARVLEQSYIELRPMRALIIEATRLAITLNHPSYDCLYLALAIAEECPFATADDSFVRKLAGRGVGIVLSVADAARLVSSPP